MPGFVNPALLNIFVGGHTGFVLEKGGHIAAVQPQVIRQLLYCKRLSQMFADILQGVGYIIIDSGLRHTVSLHLCHNCKKLMKQGKTEEVVDQLGIMLFQHGGHAFFQLLALSLRTGENWIVMAKA